MVHVEKSRFELEKQISDLRDQLTKVQELARRRDSKLRDVRDEIRGLMDSLDDSVVNSEEERLNVLAGLQRLLDAAQ